MLHLRFNWVILSLQFNPVLGKGAPLKSERRPSLLPISVNYRSLCPGSSWGIMSGQALPVFSPLVAKSR